MFRCATCVFFSLHRPDWLDRPSTRGQCRRNAPVLDRHADGQLRTVWPMVHQDAYCGEHAELEQVVAGQAAEPGAAQEPAWRCDNCRLDHPYEKNNPPARCTCCGCRAFVKVEP